MNINKKIKLIKSLKNSFSINQVSIGSWMQIPSSEIAEIMSYAGYDWVAVDMEHGSISFSQLPDIFRALELGGTLPFVRVPKSEVIYCNRSLDSGAVGLFLPDIKGKKQLENIINGILWPPDGIRGVGFSRANLYGKYFSEYKQIASNAFIIPMIEDIKVINELEEILSLKRVDALFIGPYDLSASMGIVGDFKNKEFINTIKYIKKICSRNNTPVGIHVVTPSKKDLIKKVQEGYGLIAYSSDSIFLEKNATKPVDTIK